ncbi:MAG: GTPase Era [Magnetococcales bacterium]|nr:GTPase Era [Magnetococcales bacterium]NGZ28597.1 GTPase Era [Magnetococcales bacterium]
MSRKKETFHSGFAAIVGRPNMGKSTFLNHVLGRKVAAVTPKPQTTRTRILGVCHRPHSQLVFVDTPGIHQSGGVHLNKVMVDTAYRACRDVEVILYFVDAMSGLLPEDHPILTNLWKRKIPVVLVVNKADRIQRDRLLPLLAALPLEQFPFVEVIPISALTGENVERLLKVVENHMPEGPPYFPEDQDTDQSERFLAAEMVREKLFLYLRQELPYSLAVQTESFQELPGRMEIHVQIMVDRDSQKGIIIGKRGDMLKRVGSEARRDLEKLFGVPVFLQTWVKVRKDWAADMRLLREVGYLEEGSDGNDHPGG